MLVNVVAVLENVEEVAINGKHSEILGWRSLEVLVIIDRRVNGVNGEIPYVFLRILIGIMSITDPDVGGILDFKDNIKEVQKITEVR